MDCSCTANIKVHLVTSCPTANPFKNNSARSTKDDPTSVKEMFTLPTISSNASQTVYHVSFHTKSFIQWIIGSSFETLLLVCCAFVGIKCQSVVKRRKQQEEEMRNFTHFELYDLNEDDEEVIYTSTSV